MNEDNEGIRPGLDIAVIGMAGRFPGARNTDEFWKILKNGEEPITFFSEKELKGYGISPELLKMSNYVKAKPMVDDIEYFDAYFFGFTPREAEKINPQLRLLLECAWFALEEAGYDPDRFDGAIGCFAGGTNNFVWQGRLLFSAGGSTSDFFHTLHLTDKDHLSTFISYKLNLRGPSFTFETQCSTSLVAVHLSCQALLSGECDMALAGGATITTPTKSGYIYEEGMILSPDGHLRAFDAQANGSVFGEGAGMVLLKPIEEAVADGDNILAVIRGSFINNDGNRKIGYSAPSVEGQAEAIRTALELAQVETDSISYIEAHGTATSLGDQIELEALKIAFDTEKKHFCRLGTVKTNMGHLDNAAGVAGLIKTVMSLKHRLITKVLHFQTPNPNIDFEDSPFVVNTELCEWKNGKYPLRAGISSFGIGGSNAIVIVEEPPELKPSSESRQWQLLPLSAKTDTALEQASANLARFFEENHDVKLADAAFTLQVGRKIFRNKKVVVCASGEEAVYALSGDETGYECTSPNRPIAQTFCNQYENRPTYFMFSGLGSQYVNMGVGLYRDEPVFREEIDRCFSILKSYVNDDLKGILYPASGSEEEAEQKINHPEVSLILIFIFEYALAKLLLKWGIQPDAMIGYSFGEYTAACLAGVFSLEDALELIVYRGQLIQTLPEGAMLSVPLSRDQVEPMLDEGLYLSIDNGPSCVVAGLKESVDTFEKKLKSMKLLCMRVPNSYAVHSGLMEPILQAFEEKVSRISLDKPRIPYVSVVTGDWIKDEEAADPAYWSKHLRQTVRFADGIKELVKEPHSIFVEIGPGRDLSSLVMRYMEENSNQHVINLIRHPQKNVSDSYYLLNKLGWLWLYGIGIDWAGFYEGERRHRIALPTYPLERQYQWAWDDQPKKDATAKSKKPPEGKLPDIADWFSVPQWERGLLMSHKSFKTTKQSCQLVFINETGFSVALEKRLRSQDSMELIMVEKGNGFSKIGEKSYAIDPQKGEDYKSLMEEIDRLDREPVRIVHLWSIGENGERELDKAAFDAAQELGLFSIFFLSQAIAKQAFSGKTNLFILSNGVHEVTGEEVLFPEKTTILGFSKAIQQELVNIKCRCVDIVMPEPQSRVEESLTNRLMEEFSTPSPDTVIAYRGAYRWVETYTPTRLEEVDGDIPRLKTGGVYLITGGMGRVGFILARYLAETYQARLILFGRSQLPPRSEWQDYLAAHEKTDSNARKISKILELEELGGEVMAGCADVADEQQMKRLIAEAEQHFGAINGVIHAAAILNPDIFRIISMLDRKVFEVQFPPKVYGLLVLKKLFENRPLDFCLVVSTPASILAGLSFGSYAATNNFLDAFVYWFNRQSRTPWITVNWADWEPEEKQVSTSSSVGSALEEMLMTPQEGVETFRRILKYCCTNQILVSAGDMQERFDQWVKLESMQVEDKSQQKKKRSLNPRPNLITPYVAPENHVQEVLAEIWSDLFGYDKVGIDDDFFELGGDSLKVVMVIARIHKKLNVVMTLTEFFKRPTIEKIVEYIETAETSAFVAINPVEKREYYPVSSAQKRLYFLQIMDKNSLGYNEFQVVALDGELVRNRLEKALSQLIRRHESLRTEMTMIGSDLCQRIHGEVEFAVNYYEADANGVKSIVDRFIQPFDLSRPPFMRVGVIQTGEKKYVFMIDMHHIITDGVSSELFIKEFTALYANQELAPLRVQYKDYTRWQQMQRTQGSLKEQEEYWLAEFTGKLPVLELPTDFPRPPLQSFLGNTVGFELGINETKRLKELALENDLTLFMLLISAFTVLLAKLSGQTDIIVGTPTAGRRHEDLQSIIGVFINTLVIRSQPVGEKTIAQYLGEIKDITLQAFENQDYQFEDLIERVAVNRDMSRNPLFDVMFILQNMDVQPEGIPEAKISDVEVRPYFRPGKISKFDLTLTAVESHDNLSLKFQYCTKLFKIDSIERMLRFLRVILASVRQGWDRKIGEIEILTDEEKTQILYTFNNTAAPYPQEQTVHGLFESRVKGSMLQPALVYQQYKLSFEECNDQANRLAAELRDRGVGANSIVALMVERSVEMMLAILGILKAGGAYLPIDPDFPEERIKYMLKDSQAALLVTQERFSDTFGDMCHCLNLDDFPFDGSESVAIEPVNRAADLVYVTYTSGSTGNPKGVMIQHRAVVNFIKAMTGLIEFSQKDCVLSLTTISFDIFGLETLVPLTVGTAVVIGSREEQLNTRAAAVAVESKRVTILQVTPSKLQLILSSPEAKRILTPLKYLLVGGELFPQPVLEEAREIVQGRIFNLYGPTETTIWSTARDVTGKDVQLNIGKPIANTTTYVLEKNGFPTPIGVAGELYIGGAGLSRGYLNRPDLTAGQFSPHQHLTPGSPRLYRSGDLVRWLPDGELEILGRIDHQVKVRGFRIEPGEIESQLLKRGDIKDALVTVKNDNKREKSIFAYIVPTNGSDDFDAALLREYLSLKLPEYMIPSYFVRLEAIPLMASGKVDHKALESDGMMIGTEVEYTPPETELEMTLTEIWREVLGVDKVGIHDNFFNLGGNSIGVISLNTKIKEVLNLDIPVVVVYRYLTVSSLAKYLMQGDSGMDQFVRKTDRTEEFRRGKDRIKQRIKRRATSHEQIN
jgi:amino acid adenylation domain-containing protein